MDYTADFETTTEKNLEIDGEVRVWLWTVVSLDRKEKYYGRDIEEFFILIEEKEITKIWFHNLAFDGSFIIYWLLKQGYEFDKEFSCIIDRMNVYYSITIQFKNFKCRIWDSLKKFPGLGVDDIGKMYGIGGKDKKPDFTRYIPKDYQPTEEEIHYCFRDSEIMAYALFKEYEKGNKRMTLASDSFAEIKAMLGNWRHYMPEISEEMYKFLSPGYHGGWSYLKEMWKNLDTGHIRVYDVNSLYPYVMHFCPLPCGNPHFTKIKPTDKLYVVKFTTVFKIKPNHLPTIQIKNNILYNPREYLKEVKEPVTLVMTNIDYELFKDQYDIEYEDNHTYVWFDS